MDLQFGLHAATKLIFFVQEIELERCRYEQGRSEAMRYMNWDVLLFPDGSKTPLQEFKTNCFVTQDPGNHLSSHTLTSQDFLLTAQIDPTSYHDVIQDGLSGTHTTPPRYLPTVASFVPSISLGAPFKVSVHSWDPPVANPNTLALAGDGDKILFEARVTIDGIYVAGVLFDQQPPWPQVIDTCSHPNKDSVAIPLTFPAFHSEMLVHNHWNAGENLGRIKVVIAEGIGRGHNSRFEKLRGIICFAFQHAPLSKSISSMISQSERLMLDCRSVGRLMYCLS